MADDERSPKPPGRRSVPPPPPRRGAATPSGSPPAAPLPPGASKAGAPPPPPRRQSAEAKAVRVVPPPMPVTGPGPASPKPPAVERAAAPEPAVPAPTAERVRTDHGMGSGEPSRTPVSAQRMIRDFLAELAREPDPLRLGRLHYELGRLYESPLGDLGSAADHFQRAYALCPDHVPTLRGARRVLMAKKSFQAALPLFDAEARYTPDPAYKALLFYEKGRLLDDVLGQKREARESYAGAHELDPTNPTFLKALERSDLGTKTWDALDRTYEWSANAVGTDVRHRAALLVERARLVESHKGDSRTATELFNEALGFDDRAPGALDALKRLHYAHQRWRDLVDVLRREADQASDPNVRAMAYYRMGRVLVDRLGHVDEAVSAFERAAAEAPRESLVLEELARLFELLRRWDALVGVLERVAEQARSDAERVGFFHRIGQICEERLGDEARATSWFARALAADAVYLPALQALGKIYTRRKQWEPLIAMHLGEAGATHDAARRATAHSRVAAIYEEQLGNGELAAQHHARALGFSPGHAPSFKALSRILQEGGKWRELIELFERAVDEGKDAETKITYLFKIGRVYEDALDAASNALAAYKRILEVAPQHAGAIHAMQRAAERAGRHKDLVSALELEAEKTSDKRLAVVLLQRAGEVLEDHLDDADGALARYKRVTGLDPGYLPALSAMGRLRYQAGRWEDLLETYKRELEASPRSTGAAALLYKMGELCEDRIARDDDAVGYYRRAIEADAFHLPALHALERKLAERGQWPELVKLVELELSGLTDPELRARTAFRLGEIYENRLSQPDKALAAYEQSLAAQPDFRPALDGRSRLLVQARDFRRLVEELGRELEHTTDPVMAVGALIRQGEIWRDELEDARRAIDCFEAVLTRDPSHLGALLALESLYPEIGAWDQLARTYASQARVLTDVGARVAALRELTRLEETRGIGSPDEVRAAYIAILQLSPSDAGALAALERIALGTGDGQLLTHVDAKLGSTLPVPQLAAVHQTRLAETLEAMGDPSALETFRAALARDQDNLAAAHGIVRIAERVEDPRLLGEAAEAAFRALRDPELGARLCVQSATLRAGQGDWNGALASLESALERNPDSADAAAHLKQMLLGRGDVDRLFDGLCQAAQWAKSPERTAALWNDVAEVLADHKRDIPAALAALHRVIEDQPSHLPTLIRLADLYARDAQWAEAVDRLKQVLSRSPPPELEVQAHLALARILKDHLGDEARALVSLDRVIALDPSNRDAVLRLLEIQSRRGQLSEAAVTAAKLVSVATNDAERAEALCILARLERQTKQHDAAAHAYEQAVSLMGLGGTAAAEFKDLLLEQKLLGEDPRWDYYVQALNAFGEQTTDVAVRSSLALEMARVLGDEMELSDRALATLQRGLSGEPGNAALRAELSMRLKRAGHYQQAIVELRRLLEGDILRAQTWRDLVESFQKLGRTEEAALYMAPLVALGQANDLERSTLSTRTPRTWNARPGAFDEVALRGIDARGGTDLVAGVLSAVSETIGKIFPPELERYGVTSRDRITTRSGHPLKAFADRIAQSFGPLEFDIYLHRAHSGSLEIEPTDPPGIMVPAPVTGLRESEQVFLLARPLALLARGIHPVLKLAPAELALLVACALRLFEPTHGIGMADEEFMREHAKRIAKAISRKARRSLEEIAPAALAAPQVDFEQWSFDARKTAARAAAVLADDLPGAVALLRRSEGDLAGLRGAALQQGTALVQDVIRFWASDPAFTLRRRLGMM